MAIRTRCPNCDASYTLADAQRGKKVRCRECSDTFVVGDGAPPAMATGRSGKLPKDALQTSPRPASRTPPPRTRPSAVRRDRDRYDDDRDDGPRRAPAPRKKSGSSTPIILLIVGAVLVIFLMCGGVAIVGAYWFTSSTVTDGIDNIAQNMPNDPGFGVAPGAVDPGPPKDLGEAIAWVKAGDTAEKQNRGADWLAKARVDDGRRKEAAAALEILVGNPNTHEAAARGLAQWAGPENVPTLVRIVDADDRLWDFGAKGGEPAAALVRLGDARAAAPFAKRLETPAHADAESLLAALGADAEKDVLRYMDSPNNEAHADVEKLLTLYGTKAETKTNQAVADLKSPDSGYEQKACEYLAKVPVDQARRAEVAKAMELALNDAKPETRKAAALALKTWGTKDQVPALIAEMDRKDDPWHGGQMACMEALARLPDEKGAEAVAAHLSEFGVNREAVVQALITMGPVAEKAVVKYLNHRDPGVSEAANRILKTYGSKGDVIITAMIDDLSSPEEAKRKGAAEYFEKQPADEEHRTQVARALEKALDDRSPFGWVREPAARALGAWGDKDSAPALLSAMQKPNNGQLWQLSVDALVQLKDERVVEPLIMAAAGDFFHKEAAKKALNDLGPVVETALDDIVKDPNAVAQRRANACELIANPANGIGTAKSIPVLQAAAADQNATVKAAATRALNLLKKRV